MSLLFGPPLWPSVSFTVCVTLSLFVQVTVVPFFTVIEDGVKAKFWMVTLFAFMVDADEPDDELDELFVLDDIFMLSMLFLSLLCRTRAYTPPAAAITTTIPMIHITDFFICISIMCFNESTNAMKLQPKIFTAHKSDPQAAAILLRVGLGLVFLYAAISTFLQPLLWEGYFPAVLLHLAPIHLVLYGMATYELCLAFALLAGIRLRLAALLCILTLGGIVATNLGQLIVTFRDVGLLFAALALFMLA